MDVYLYLRKSRADEEKKITLDKHKEILYTHAHKHNIVIKKEYREIASGENIIHRPQMINLLKDLEKKPVDGVLCMDMDRLGRGNMQDQGLILETFKNTKTLIITPRKTYNLQDEFDEEYSEFEAFMSRKELKLITRRMQRGRVLSVEKGNYIATLPPYGYEIEYKDKIRTLKPHPAQANVVKMIFNLYICGMGGKKIANHLNSLGIKSYTDNNWESTAPLNIIKNPVYIGKVCWKKKEHSKSKDPNKKREVKLNNKKDWIICDGYHPAIISEYVFKKANEILSKRYHIPYQIENGAKNPLAGIILCKDCGAKMLLRPYKKLDSQLMCSKNCGNKSSKIKFVEQRLLDAIKSLIDEYEINLSNNDFCYNNLEVIDNNIKSIEISLNKLTIQKNSLHDLLEQGIYDVDTFRNRFNILQQQINDLDKSLKSLTSEKQSQARSKKDTLKELKKVYDLYYRLDTADKKNYLLKSIIDYAHYKKLKSQRNDEFSLNVYLKV